MRKKNLIIAFTMALNAILSSYTAAETTTKYDRLFNNIVKNTEKDYSNKKNYQLIESILKQKNKELKDLYFQGDYIIKPEYLEWQIFMSAFYSDMSRGDNTSESAEYRSGTDGYYDENGRFISSTQGMKSYKREQEVKTIDLGMSIPLKGLKRENFNVEVNPSIQKPQIPSNPNQITLDELAVPTLDLLTFNPKDPILNTVSAPPVNIKVVNLKVYDSFGGDTLVGATISTNFEQNLGSGTYTLSDVEGSSTTTGYAPTSDNAIIDYGYKVANTKTYIFSSDVDTVMYVDVAQRRGVALDASVAKLTFNNNGKIYLQAQETTAMEIQTGASPHMAVVNTATGEIIGSNINQAAMMYTVEDGNSIVGNHLSEFTNDGKIILGGSGSTGILLNAGELKKNPGVSQTLNGINNNIITLNGKGSYGLVLSKDSVVTPDSVILNGTNGVITINETQSGGVVVLSDVGTQSLNQGKININSSEESFGLYSTISTELTNDGLIDIQNSNKTMGLTSLGAYLSNGTSGKINIKGGTENIGMFASDGKVENHGDITISAGNANAGVILEGASSGKNSGQITVSGTKSIGVSINNTSSFESTGLIQVEGTNSYGLISQGGTLKGGTVDIDINGEDSIGVYAGGTSASIVEVTGGDVNLSNGGVNFNVGLNGTLNLSNTNFVVGQNSLGFYATNSGVININNLTGTIKGGVSSADRGTAFSINGAGVGVTQVSTISDLVALMSTSGINPTNLTLNMDSGSRLFSLGEASINLSVVNALNSSSVSLTGVTLVGSDYKTVLLSKGLLNIDEVADLDDPDSNYARMEIAGSSITNANLIKGTGNSQQGMAQANTGGATKNVVTLKNNGTISLSGQKSIGIYADNGIVENNNIINISGKSSYGIYGVNGTEVITGVGSEIKVADEGAGIVLQSYAVDPVTGLLINTTYGDKTFKLNHNGIITLSGIETFGVYADNNSTSIPIDITTRIVNLNSGSMIDLSQVTDKGVGVYANKSTINTSGDIKIGSNSVGVYSESSKLNISGGTIELTGDGGTAILLNGTSDLTATGGTINVKGNNTTAYVIGKDAVISGIDNILVNLDPGLKFTLANVKNNTFIYDGVINGLGEESVLIYGDNSDIGLGVNSIITSTSDKVLGLATTGQKAVNKGEVSLTGSNSTGIYTDGADAINEGKLILGINGIGIYNKGALIDSISGEIQTGESGIGILGVDSTSIRNNALINSIEKSVIGIYSEGDITGTLIQNDISGNISLTGDNSIGIYATGNAIKNIINDGVISVGNSADINNPSVGIYSNTAGNIITNNNLSAGDNSLGIYNNAGTVTQNGNLSVGNSGTGIYSLGGAVTINSSAGINIGSNEAVAVYGIGANIINDSSNINLGNKSFGFILETGSTLVNNGSITLGDENVFIYGDGAGTITNSNSATISATGSNNIAFYTVNGGDIINDSIITANTGTGNIGIYNNGGSIENNGDILIGDTELVYNGNVIDTEKTKYSVGVYGENSTSVVNNGNIDIGNNAVGIYVKDNMSIAKNYGLITAGSSLNTKTGAIGIFIDGGEGFENHADITLYGNGVIGIAGKNAKKIINHAVISVTGENSIGIYGTLNTEIENKGTINVSGNNGIGIVASDGKIINEGTINFTDGASSTKTQDGYPIPELINAGIINVNGHFSNEGMEISLKPDLSTIQESTISGIDFILSSGTITANSMNITDTVKILPDFSQGTNAKVYKLEDVFVTNNGTITSSNGKIPVVSKSLTWVATPKVNASGNVDIYMQKIDYHDFTDGLWYDEFGIALDENYVHATGDAGKIFDNIDLIEKEKDFRHVMASMAGNIYSNINQRVENIAKTLENSLDLLQDSKNNTKENVKLNVIAGKGRSTEDTDGVVGYDYTTTGILALREVERTYKHTFGYSLGYLHTGFEFKDGNSSEEWADTIQLGVHNKYSMNSWKMLNNLTGRVNFHNIDRNINWPDPTGVSEINGRYETYSITSDNILGKEYGLGKWGSLTPYGAFRATYITRPSFSEKGLEALEVKGSDAWSVKPRAGVELKGSLLLGKNTGWQLKGALDIAYEYELANLDEREKARLISVESNYHKLSKPEDEKGRFTTKASMGVELDERYGIFINGEYGIGNSDRDDYRAGLTLKAVF